MNGVISNHSVHAGIVHSCMMQHFVIFGGEIENILGRAWVKILTIVRCYPGN